MQIEHTPVTKMTIRAAGKLPPIAVIMEDYGPGQGKLTITCDGEAWTNYWPAMGERTLREFLATCSGPDYVTGKLFNGESREVDWDAVAQATGIEWIGPDNWHEYEAELDAAYPNDWRMDLPQHEAPKFSYVKEIVSAVIAATRDDASVTPNARVQAQGAQRPVALQRAVSRQLGERK